MRNEETVNKVPASGGAFDQYIVKDDSGNDITATELLSQLPIVLTTYDLQENLAQRLSTLRLAKGQTTAVWNSMTRADDTRDLLEKEVDQATDQFIREKGDETKTGLERWQVRKMFKWDSLVDNSESLELNEGRRNDLVKKMRNIHQIMEKAASQR